MYACKTHACVYTCTDAHTGIYTHAHIFLNLSLINVIFSQSNPSIPFSRFKCEWKNFVKKYLKIGIWRICFFFFSFLFSQFWKKSLYNDDADLQPAAVPLRVCVTLSSLLSVTNLSYRQSFRLASFCFTASSSFADLTFTLTRKLISYSALQRLLTTGEILDGELFYETRAANNTC